MTSKAGHVTASPSFDNLIILREAPLLIQTVTGLGGSSMDSGDFDTVVSEPSKFLSTTTCQNILLIGNFRRQT